jgi:hypothetical protein
MSAQLRVCHTTAKQPPQKYLDLVPAGLKAAAKKWKCVLDPSLGDQLEGIFKYEGRESTRFGNHCIEPATKNNYEGVLRQYWRICIQIPDYESMLALLSPRPDGTPSLRVTTLDLSLRYKLQTPGIDLLTYNNRDILYRCL